MKKPKPGTLGSVIAELRAGTYVANARQRATRRKSAWSLLLPVLILPLWLTVWWVLVVAALAMRELLAGQAVHSLNQLTAVLGGQLSPRTALMVVPTFAPALVVAMVVGNFLAYRVPPARRAFDREAQAAPGTDYGTAQRTLGKLAAISAAIALPFVALGVWLP